MASGARMIERLRLRHEAAQGGILAVDAGNLVRIFDGPGVGFAGRRSGAFHHGLPGKAVVGEELVDGVPLLPHRARLRREGATTMWKPLASRA